ncbi:hypothetical protein U8Y98_27310 [Priestia megaterium]|uniref:hypothetical protein n=1 Tax=Priestia megaterium TaxID=1404 RepID=UPI002FE08B39
MNHIHNKAQNVEIVNMSDHYIVKNQQLYFKLGIEEGEILQQIQNGKSISDVVAEFNKTEKYIEDFLSALDSSGIFTQTKEKFNVFFMKFPFYNPSRFLSYLTRILKEYKFLNMMLKLVSFLVFFGGIYSFTLNYKEIFSNVVNDLSFNSLLILYISIFIVTFIHEIGHALSCQYFGGKVEKIGFLLIFFSPALYTDISSIRVFKNKKHIIYVLLAGSYFQLLVVSIVLFIRPYFPEYQSLIDQFVTINIISTVSNFVPFIRLDGYWILSTLLDIPNLYKKSFQSLTKVKQVKINNKKENIVLFYGLLNVLFFSFSFLSGIYGLYWMAFLSPFPSYVKTAIGIIDSIIYIYLIATLVKGIFYRRKKLAS